MAGSDLSSVSPEDSGFARSYVNGVRGTHPGSSLDGVGSSRENGSGRSFSTGASMLSKGRASDLPPLSRCLMLESVPLDDQKFTRCSELRRAIGFFSGGISEENSKPASALATDGLKHLRRSIQDGNDKARIRVTMLDDSLNNLTAYLRKLQINERSSRPNLLKTGAQPHMKSPDPVTHRGDDISKNALCKRVRTPVADTPVEGQGTGIPRQHMVLGKDKDITKQGSLSSGSVDEKMCPLPGGGESWDRKMKRRRSVSNGFSRPVDGDGDIKRTMHGNLSTDSVMPSSDAPAFRLGSFDGVAVDTKPDGTPSASGSNVRLTPKNEKDKVSFLRDLGGMNKEKISQKGDNKVNIRDENHVVNLSLMTKGKASRASKAGPPIMGDSSPTFSHMASTPEDWELTSNVNKVHSLGGINNRKRAFSSESPSPPMAQWVGQRPQKNSRIRRSNIISPTSNNDEALILSDGCAALPASNFVLNSGGFNGSLPARSMASDMQQLKEKSENTPSPARLSESEETGAVENITAGSFESEERGVNGYPHVSSPGLLTKKTKVIVREEIGDGVRKQGRSGRGSSFSAGSMSPLGGKLDAPATAKSVQSTKPCPDKNGSKSGRPPPKKQSERKGVTRLGLVSNGVSDDDREDLLAAAQFTCNANYHACSSSFWKKMEPLFSIMADDKSYLLQQLNALEELHGSPSELFKSDNDMKDTLRDEKHQPRSVGSEGEKVVRSCGFEPTKSETFINQGQDNDVFCRRDFENGHNGMYQRVLSALIMEDEFEEDQSYCGRNSSFFSASEVAGSMEDNIVCNGNTHRSSNIDSPSQVDLCQGGYDFMQSEVGILPASSQSNPFRLLTSQINMSSDSSSQDHYALMSMDEKLLAELQSIGLHLETGPGFAEGEDEVFSEEILQLNERFHQEANNKKLRLERLWKAVKVEHELKQWELEQIAVSRLVVLAYRKLLATRGSTVARMGVSKIPRNVAMAFVKRTLARCRKFENTGKSCFSEPGLWDVILAGPSSCSSDGLPDQNLQSQAKVPGSNCAGTGQLGLHNDKPGRILVESCHRLSGQPNYPYAKNDPILNTGKKKEVRLDDVGNGASLKPSLAGNTLMGGVKGKRSERDRDKDISSKSGRLSITHIRGERKAKAKPKQREPQQLSRQPPFPPTSSSAELVANGINKKQQILTSPDSILDASREGKDPAGLTKLPLHELDSVELSVDDTFAGHQDLSSWLSFDDDTLQDDDIMGLEIPMDDLSELSMLL